MYAEQGLGNKLNNIQYVLEEQKIRRETPKTAQGSSVVGIIVGDRSFFFHLLELYYLVWQSVDFCNNYSVLYKGRVVVGVLVFLLFFLGCFPYVAELRWRSVMLLLLFFSRMECNAAYFCSHCMNHTGTQMIQTHIEPYNKLISSNIYGRLVYYKLLSLTHTHVIAIPIAAFN